MQADQEGSSREAKLAHAARRLPAVTPGGERFYNGDMRSTVADTSHSTETVLQLLRRLGVDHVPSRFVRGELFTFVNPHAYTLYHADPAPLSRFSGLYVDGVLLQVAGRAAGVRLRRQSFDMTGVAPAVFRLAAELGKRLFVLGSTPEANAAAVERIHEGWPDLKVCGARHGYFDTTAERAEALAAVRDLQPDLVIAGMGVPLQERALLDLRDAGWEGTGYTCGGFLHQLVDRLHYYPSWADRFELRWAYRACTDANVRRKLRTTYPRFLARFVTDLRAGG